MCVRACVCEWEIIGLSPRHSAFCWCTAGTQLAGQVTPTPTHHLHHLTPPTATPPKAECQKCRLRSGLTRKNISVNREDERGSYDGASAPKIHLEFWWGGGSVIDRQVFLSGPTNPSPAPRLRGDPVALMQLLLPTYPPLDSRSLQLERRISVPGNYWEFSSVDESDNNHGYFLAVNFFTIRKRKIHRSLSSLHA